MEGKILHEVKGMSGEQKARIRNHPNGRQPGHIPEQSTVADQKQGEQIRHLMKRSESPPFYTSRIQVCTTSTQLTKSSRKSESDFTVQTPES